MSPAEKFAKELTKTPHLTRVCNELRKKRESVGLSLTAAYVGTGILPQSFSNYENHKTQPTVGNALKIARFFGCKVEDIWQLEEQP